VPKTVSGRDLSDVWTGRSSVAERDALFCYYVDDANLTPGAEWRGVRTKTWNYFRFLNGTKGLYDIAEDPLQMHNLFDTRSAVREQMESTLLSFMDRWNDELKPAPEYRHWFDEHRQVVGNVFGALGDPLKAPDWSML